MNDDIETQIRQALHGEVSDLEFRPRQQRTRSWRRESTLRLVATGFVVAMIAAATAIIGSFRASEAVNPSSTQPLQPSDSSVSSSGVPVVLSGKVIPFVTNGQRTPGYADIDPLFGRLVVQDGCVALQMNNGDLKFVVWPPGTKILVTAPGTIVMPNGVSEIGAELVDAAGWLLDLNRISPTKVPAVTSCSSVEVTQAVILTKLGDMEFDD